VIAGEGVEIRLDLDRRLEQNGGPAAASMARLHQGCGVVNWHRPRGGSRGI
jgi:hypothetical protein